MKKIIGFLLLVFFAFEGNAQIKILDTTITNAGTPAVVSTLSGRKSNVTFEYVVTKTSGTVAGTIVLAGTIDGTNYATLNTYTLTDASTNTSVSYNYNGYTKYRITITTTGTQVSNHKIWVFSRS